MELIEQIAAQPAWYHRIALPNGVTTPGAAPLCAEKYAIPDDLTGKRVLDIGAWDGYWTWEALKRGAAEVVAIDDFSDHLGQPLQRNWETFDLCRQAFGFTREHGDPSEKGYWWENDKGQKCYREQWSVYDLAPEAFGSFDIVFFFGTIYHLQHPLLALEKIASVCTGDLYVESAICDDYSPYRGLGKGYRDNDMVTEFYPTQEYGDNASNWWVPTLQCLAYMVQSVGFANVELWRLTERPQGPSQCRGFLYASKNGGNIPANVTKQAQTLKVLKHSKVFAVMSVPRLGFQDNQFCAIEALLPLKIPLIKVQGAFWGQCLERGLQTQIDAGAEILLAIDYDTLFRRQDLEELIRLMEEHPEVDALVPVQVGRQGKQALCTMRTRSGQWLDKIPRETFAGALAPIATGHFGLTLIRASALLKLPHPWFMPEPNRDGQWGEGRTDEDIYFWKHLKAHGGQAFLANRVVIGHLELMALWPDQNLGVTYQLPKEFYETGRPANCWR